MSRSTIKKPGVFVQNIRFQPQPIEGVDTNTTAFLGETQSGPSTPTLITSWLGYQSVFGGYFGEGKYLPYSVEGFFANGGQRCYVCRVNNNDYASALTSLEALEEISLVYVPNAQATAGLLNALIGHCERLKRFAIFDSLKGEDPCRVTKPHESSFAALYYPWIQVKPAGSSQTVLVPPGGYIAGIYARVDNAAGVHKSPANEPVYGAVGLMVALTRGHLDSLNPAGVNCIMNFEGRGIRVWGARTLSSDSLYKYVSVRRLLIYLEKSIKKGTAWATFEFNNEATWAKIGALTEDFLMQNWQKGMLMGAKPQDAYFVKCDRTTMTQNDIDNGQLNLLIGVAVTKPAEFMIVRVNQTTARP
jgi:phage tail sheath protein FI